HRFAATRRADPRAGGDTLDLQAVRHCHMRPRPGRVPDHQGHGRGPEMTTTYVALLRSVNVAGHGKIKMDELSQVFRMLGYTEVATYIQSGNVIFTSKVPVPAASL